MAAIHFNYADYLLYAAAKNVNDALYSTVAHGVLGTLKNQFAIYIEEETISQNLFIDDTVFYIPAEPIKLINSITYDGNVIDPTTYSWYGRDVVLTTPISEYRKPIIFDIDVGYTEIPTDLKLAVYRHIDSIIFSIDKDVSSIESVTNSTGNSTKYKCDYIPLAVLSTYEFYSARTQVMS